MEEKVNRCVTRVSRRGFFSSAGAASAGLFAASSVLSRSVNAADDTSGGINLPGLSELPNPIPHTAQTPFGSTVHGFLPGPVEGTLVPTDPTGAHPNGRDPSEIFDFIGFIGQADLSFTGTGTDLNTGASAPYVFNADVRFMKGTFVSTDGKARQGAFAFI
jgi:hypothetical protein